MTPRQLQTYWRLWGRVTAANRWKLVLGYIHPQARSDRSPEHQAVWQLAEALADRAEVNLTPEHLRHACHIRALGRDKSSKDIGTTREASRLFALLRLLTDPDDIQARIDFDGTADDDARRRLLWRINHSGAPEAYITHICRSKFPNWTGRIDNLSTGQLRHLIMTLSQRTAGFHQPIPEQKP